MLESAHMAKVASLNKWPGWVKVLVLLVTLVIVLIMLFLFTSGNKYVDAFLPNLITEFIGALVIIFVIDWLLNIEKHRANKKYAARVEKRIAAYIQRIQHTFGEMIKSVVSVQDLDGVTTYEQLFSEDNVKQLRYFDYKKSPPELSYSSWVEYVSEVLRTSEDGCGQVINSFFTLLDPDLVGAIDKFFSDPTYVFTKNANKIIPLTEEHSPRIKGFIAYLIPPKNLMDTFRSLLDVTRRLQTLNPEVSFHLDPNLLHPSVAPAPGSCRLPDEEVDCPPSASAQ